MNSMDGAGVVPFVASNNIGVFTVFNTESGLVESYAFDTRNPDGDVVLFDVFPMDLEMDPVIFPFGFSVGGWKYINGLGWIVEQGGAWVWSDQHQWLFFDAEYAGMDEFWFWDSELAWTYSAMDLLPLMYSLEYEAWLYHLEGSSPRLFYDLNQREWIQP